MAAGAFTLGAELAAAVLWPAPFQDEFDPSGRVGPPMGSALRVAALGDSSCTGPGVASADEIWLRLLATRLSADLTRPVELRSFARGGACARHVRQEQLTGAVAWSPELALVSVGANDVIRGVPMRRFSRDLDTIVGSLAAAGSLVVTSGVGDLGTIPRLAPPLRQIAAGLGRRADRVHAEVATRHGIVKAEQWDWSRSQFRTRRDVWSPDRFHPSAAGHVVWAETAWTAMEPLLGRLRGMG
jgi:lysophospholipase L1-like esterase